MVKRPTKRYNVKGKHLTCYERKGTRKRYKKESLPKLKLKYKKRSKRKFPTKPLPPIPRRRPNKPLPPIPR